MDWPALSPDLNPIEYLWDEVQIRLNLEQPRPTNAAELFSSVSESMGTHSNSIHKSSDHFNRPT